MLQCGAHVAHRDASVVKRTGRLARRHYAEKLPAQKKALMCKRIIGLFGDQADRQYQSFIYRCL